MSDLPVYRGWEAVPSHLKTKTSLSKEGLRLVDGQPVIAIVQTKFRSKINRYDLYDCGQAIPKKVLSEAQIAALEKAKHAARAAKTCQRCGLYQGGRTRLYKGNCENCNLEIMIEQDHEDAIWWARGLLYGDALILDTETTGLYNAEIIQIGITDMTGRVLMNQYIKPQNPERMMEYDDRGKRAVDIHGITPEMLADKPTFPEIYPALRKIIEGKNILIWNAEFDQRLLNEEVQRYKLEPFQANAQCAMNWYSAWVGDWSQKYEDYRFQALGGSHDAIDDCRIVIERLREMAEEMRRGPKSAYEEFLEKQRQEADLIYWNHQAQARTAVYYAAVEFVAKATPAEAWPKKDQERGKYRNILLSVPEYMYSNLTSSLGVEEIEAR